MCDLTNVYEFSLLKSHETVDRTDRNASNQGRQLAQEENQQRARELERQLGSEREQALREAQERARCEDENQRRILDQRKRQREERERKMREEKEFIELQDALINYDFQKRPRIKKESFRDLDVSDIDVVRIALIGPTGSGKTSFVGKKSFFVVVSGGGIVPRFVPPSTSAPPPPPTAKKELAMSRVPLSYQSCPKANGYTLILYSTGANLRKLSLCLRQTSKVLGSSSEISGGSLLQGRRSTWAPVQGKQFHAFLSCMLYRMLKISIIYLTISFSFLLLC